MPLTVCDIVALVLYCQWLWIQRPCTDKACCAASTATTATGLCLNAICRIKMGLQALLQESASAEALPYE